MQAKCTLGRRIAVFVLTVLTAVYFNATPCLAQSAVDSNGEITDLVVGRNNKGPYTLSWTDIDPRSVSVIMDGRTLKKGGDYTIDTAKGIIAFDRILLTDAIVRVSYKPTQGKSKANNSSVDVPISLDLVSRQDASLNITGLYAQPDPKKPDAAKTIVGLGGSKSWGGTKLSSQFLVSQRNANSNGADDASNWDKSVMKFSSETKLGGLSISGNFSHAGTKFDGAKEYKTDLGKEASDIAAIYSAGNSLQAAFKFKKSDDTAASAKGTASEVMEQSLIYSPFAGTKLSVARNSTDTSGKSVASKAVDSTSIKLDQMIGKGTTALAAVETSKTLTGGKLEEVESKTFAVNSNAINGINVQTSLVDKNTTSGGQEQVRAASVASDQKQKISFTAGITDADSVKKGRSTASNYGVRFADKTMQLQMKSVQSVQVGKEQSQQDVTFASAFAGKSKVTADYTRKGLNDKEDTTFGTGLELAIMEGTGLSLTHRDSSFSNAAKTVGTDTIQLSQRFGVNTNAVASLERSSIAEGTKVDDVQVQKVAVNTAVIPGFAMQASTTSKTSSLTGKEDAYSANVKVGHPALPGIQGQVATSQTQSSQGLERNLTAGFLVNPIKAVMIKGDRTSAESTKKGVTEKSNLSMSLQSGFATLSATMTGATQNTNEQYKREVNLTSTPFSFMKFVTQFVQKGVNDNDDVTKSAMVELAPFTHTRLRTGFKYVETGTNVLTVRDYGAETNPWEFISLSGAFRDREVEAGTIQDTKSAKIALKPVTGFSLTGEYAENPEDVKTGAIQAVKTTGMGVNLRIGSVGLVTKYTSKNEYQVDRLSDEAKLGLEMNAFGRGKLTTDVKLSRLLGGAELATRTYSVGYKHDIGGDFSLTLSGYYTESLQNKILMDDKTEVGAQANIGLKW